MRRITNLAGFPTPPADPDQLLVFQGKLSVFGDNDVLHQNRMNGLENRPSLGGIHFPVAATLQELSQGVCRSRWNPVIHKFSTVLGLPARNALSPI